VKIRAVEVDGFGVWSGLKLDNLSEGLSVFFGPNEAGKTTLMQFVRSVLYGFTSQRGRYLPPLRGGRPGGSLHVAGPNGSFQVSRHQDQEDPDGDDEISLSASDGARQGPHLLKVLLSNVDESIFNNVFALGLHELQELGTLNDTEAASLLFSLSAGLDRVALVDVVRELEGSRNRLLSADGRPCQVTHLLAERKKLQFELEQLDELSRRYVRLVAERDQLDRETVRLEEESNQIHSQARMIELAVALEEGWQRRKELGEQLHALGPIETMPEGAPEQLEALSVRLQKGADGMDRLRHQWEAIRTEAADLQINEALWRLAPRIEALAEQEPWIDTLQKRTSELETEITDLEAQLLTERRRFGLGKVSDGNVMPSVSARSLSVLRQPARELRQTRQRVAEARQENAASRETAESLRARIDVDLAAREERNLPEAIDRIGSLVGQLRRRTQIDERLGQMDEYQVQLEQESRELLGRQVLPAGLLMALGGMFVASAVMVMAGLFLVVGSAGWLLCLFGFAGLGAATASKFILERSNARRLEACQKQLGMLRLQANEARQERETLDRQLSVDEGSVASRLEAAEGELRELESLVPLDAQRKSAAQEADSAAERGRQARGEFDQARRRWQEALRTLGLPRKLTPKQVRDLVNRHDYVGEIERRLENRYEEYEGRRRELEALMARIGQLVTDANLTLPTENPIDQVRALAEKVREQDARLKSREALRVQARQIRRKRAKYQATIRRLKHRREEILRQVGAKDEHEFRRRAAEMARAEVLRREFESLCREIDVAIAGHCPEQAIGDLVEGNRSDQLEQRYEQLEERLAITETKLRERYEKRGRLNEQLKSLAEDQRPASLQLELSMVETRLEEAMHRWRVLAVASRILKTVRTAYEQERQPETLREASGYLERLTEGRYLRVWTPLDEDVLLVDDREGNSRPIELLSQGGREQLFLCLRLALANSFAQRGAQLPLVFDDVLVNFDNQRAKAAVAVLNDFAAAGHQVLVFTCHEHILKLFKSARVQVNRLPDSAALEATPAPARKTTRKRAKPKTPPKEVPHELVATAGPEHDSNSDDQEPLVFEAPDEPIVDEKSKPSIAELPPPVVDAFTPWKRTAFDEPVVPAEDDPGFASVDYYVDQGSYDDQGIEIDGPLASDEEHDEREHDEQAFDEEASDDQALEDEVLDEEASDEEEDEGGEIEEEYDVEEGEEDADEYEEEEDEYEEEEEEYEEDEADEDDDYDDFGEAEAA